MPNLSTTFPQVVAHACSRTLLPMVIVLSVLRSAAASECYPNLNLEDAISEEMAQVRIAPDGEHFRPGRLLLTYRATRPTQFEALRDEYGLELMRHFDNLNGEIVRLRDPAETLPVYQRLKHDPRVATVELDGLVYSALNDLQWNFQNDGQRGGSEDADVDGPEAWQITTDCTGVVVAIIDTGLDVRHPDLEFNIWENKGESGEKATNGIDDDGNGFIDDSGGWNFRDGTNQPLDCIGHGTHVAGIIGAQGNTPEGVVGVCHDVQLMPIKALGYMIGFTSDIVEAFAYAVDQGAQVINASFSSAKSSELLDRVLEDAYEKSVIVVAAAGNDGMDIDDSEVAVGSGESLGDSSNLIMVAATDRNDLLADYSNYGLKSVQLAAPGTSIYSTFPNASYRSVSGTSMAVPHVVGAAAMLLTQRPCLTPSEVRDILMNTTDPIDNLRSSVVSGGRLNLHTMLTDLSIRCE